MTTETERSPELVKARSKLVDAIGGLNDIWNAIPEGHFGTVLLVENLTVTDDEWQEALGALRFAYDTWKGEN